MLNLFSISAISFYITLLFFKVCCSHRATCDNSATWVDAPITCHTRNHVTLNISRCGSRGQAVGVRYAWRQTPCGLKPVRGVRYRQRSARPSLHPGVTVLWLWRHRLKGRLSGRVGHVFTTYRRIISCLVFFRHLFQTFQNRLSKIDEH